MSILLDNKQLKIIEPNNLNNIKRISFNKALELNENVLHILN